MNTFTPALKRSEKSALAALMARRRRPAPPNTFNLSDISFSLGELSPFNPPFIYHNGVESANFSSPRLSADVYVSLYTDVVLDVPTSSIRNCSGALVASTVYLIDDYSLNQYRHEEAIDLRSYGLVALGFNRPGRIRNYYHWMTQCLPAICSYSRLRSREKVKVLLPETIGDYEARSIELLGLDVDYVMLSVEAKVRLAAVAFSSHLLGCADFTNCNTSMDIYNQMIDSTLKQDRCKRHFAKNLYVSRKDAVGRRLNNEDELISFLQDEGFEIILCSQLTLDERIIAFSEAEIVVGAHGAGLTNIIFSNASCKYVELVMSDYINPCLINIAQQKGMSTWLESFPIDGLRHADGHQQEWKIELSRIKKLISSLVQ